MKTMLNPNHDTPSKYQSPPPPLPKAANNISTSILNHHGPDSEAFLNHLQMTWDMHRNMETSSNQLRAANTALAKEKVLLQQETQALAHAKTTALSELDGLRASNDSVKNEIAAMRQQLQRVVHAASNQRELKEKAMATATVVEKENVALTQQVTTMSQQTQALNQKMVALTQQLNASVEQNERFKTSLEMSQKQQRALRVTEEEMATHLQRVVDRLQESETNRAALKDQLTREKYQQTTYRQECDQLKETMERVRDTSQRSTTTIQALKQDIARLNEDKERAADTYQEDTNALRTALARKEQSSTQVLERATLNHRKMEEECNAYHQKVQRLEQEQVKYTTIIADLTTDMEQEGAATTQKLTLATARISELKQQVDMQNQTLRELEEFGTDSSKRQAIANAQMEKDGIKIRGLTMALEKTKEDALALKEAATGATAKLVRVVQERNALSTLQAEMMQGEEEKDIQTMKDRQQQQAELHQLKETVEALHHKIILIKKEKRVAEEHCSNAEQSLEDVMSQSDHRDQQLNARVDQIARDFNAAIEDRDASRQRAMQLEQEMSSMKEQEEQLLKDRQTTKVTVEATISKLEQVTEELGRRIQSETALGTEMVELRQELKETEKKRTQKEEELRLDNEAVVEECAGLEKALVKSRSIATEQREELLQVNVLLENVQDDSAKQVLAFREQADVLADETRKLEENVVHLKGQLRKTQGLLSDAVRTIETLKDELTNDDDKRNSEYEEKNMSMHHLEQRLSETMLTLKATEARYQMQQQEGKRVLEAKHRLATQYGEAKKELEVVRKQYDETRRNLLHLQRCARNASVIEKNAARFLRDATGGKSSSGSSSARGKLNGNGVGVVAAGLPEIGSPRVEKGTIRGSAGSGSGSSGGKRKNKKNERGSSKMGLRPGSAPLRRRDQNKV